MFESIKDWINVPYNLRPFDRRDGAGDKYFKDVVELPTYPVFEVKYVRNSLGADVISNNHFYIEGKHNISVLDEIQVDNTWLPIIAIDTFYRDGKPDIKVVHA